MKLKYEFVVRSVAGESFAVPVGEAARKFPGMFTLNVLGADLMEKLAEDTSEDDLIKSILEKYDTDQETAEKDVREFTDKLSEMGLLES